MPRISRGLADGHCYHVLNRGNGRQEIFHKEGDYRVFIDLLFEMTKRYSIQLFAFCLMPNHFHLLLRAVLADDLSRGLQWLMTSHVRRYHRYYGTSGHVWQGRFKSFIVQEDAHLLTVARYIEGNPLRADMVSTLAEWPWSSYRESSGEVGRTITVPLPCEPPLDWRNFVKTPLADIEQERIRQCRDRQAPYGASDWVTEICQRLGLESTLRPRGRPVKT